MRLRFVVAALLALVLHAEGVGAQPQLVESTMFTSAAVACPQQNCLQVLMSPRVASVGFEVNGAGTYVIIVEALRGPVNIATWRTVSVVRDADQVIVPSISSEGGFSLPNSGFTAIRIRPQSLSAGTPVVSMVQGALTGLTAAGAGGGGSFNGVLLDAPAGDSLTNTGLNALNVNVVGGSSSSTQYPNNTASATPTVTVAGGWDGTTVRALMTNATRHLAVYFPTVPTVAQSGTWTTRLQDGTGNAITSALVGAARALDIRVIGTGGAHVTSFGGGTEYPEGTTAATPTGTALMWKAAGDAMRSVSAANPLPVTISGGGGGGGASLADRGAFTVGTTPATPISGLRETTTTTCAPGQACAAGITEFRSLKVTPHTVNDVPVEFNQDVAEGTNEIPSKPGPVPLGVRRDVPAPSTIVSGQYMPTSFNSMGGVWTQNAAWANGGADSLSYMSVGTTEDEHVVLSAPGTIYSISAFNLNAAARFLKCNTTTTLAGTSPGTDVPKFRTPIPAATTGAGYTIDFPVGWSVPGLVCWIVTGALDNNVAEVAAAEVFLHYTLKQ